MENKNLKVNLGIDGLLLGFTGLLGIQFTHYLQIGSSSHTFMKGLVLGGLGTLGVDIYYKLFKKEEPLMLFMKNAGMEVDGQYPKIIKKYEKDNLTTYVVRMPAGISQKDFEKHQTELEQWLRGSIKFDFNFDLIITVNKKILPTIIDYVFEEQEGLKLYCGDTNDGKFILDIEKCPHCIFAGETNSGKSSILRNMIMSLLLKTNEDIDLHLIDFQSVELGMFEDCKKVKSYGETPDSFEKLMDEMESENSRRRKLFKTSRNYVVNLSTWNKENPKKKLPFKVVIVDEFAVLADSDYEEILDKFKIRVAADRKVGIHYLIAMQRPDVKCIEGAIKANMPTRFGFRTATAIDSRVILDQEGAEKITTQGRCIAKYCGEYSEIQALHITPKKAIKMLKRNNCYKTDEDKKLERKAQIEKFREKNVNPYAKKG